MPKEGYGVSITSSSDHILKGETLTPQQFKERVREYIEQNRGLDPSYHFGWWKDSEGDINLDLTKVFDTKEKAMAFVKQGSNNEHSIWDFKNGKAIKVGE